MIKVNMPTVTIGIPAYNEASNINYLLRSIMRQKENGYRLEKIIVVCDGCTDNTAMKVKLLAKKYPKISLIIGKKREGKMRRLEMLYKMNKSNVFLSCDGDVVLENPLVLNKMLEKFDNDQIVVVGGRNKPIESDTLVGNLINTWWRLWYEVRKDFKDGNNIYNIRGSFLALRKTFLNSIKFPEFFISDAQFIYFTALAKGSKFRYASDASVLIRNPNNINDYFLQKRRAKPGRQVLKEIFGNEILKEYNIPKRYKLKAIIKMLIKEPIYTPLAGLFHIWFKVFPYKVKVVNQKGIWKVVESTKDGINTGYINQKHLSI